MRRETVSCPAPTDPSTTQPPHLRLREHHGGAERLLEPEDRMSAVRGCLLEISGKMHSETSSILLSSAGTDRQRANTRWTGLWGSSSTQWAPGNQTGTRGKSAFLRDEPLIGYPTPRVESWKDVHPINSKRSQRAMFMHLRGYVCNNNHWRRRTGGGGKGAEGGLEGGHGSMRRNHIFILKFAKLKINWKGSLWRRVLDILWILKNLFFSLLFTFKGSPLTFECPPTLLSGNAISWWTELF